MKILVIGPRINQKNPFLIGGAITLFENLIDQLDTNNISYDVIDTNKKNYSNIFSAYISIFIQIIMKQKGCSHLSLHSSRDYLIIGLIIIFIGKLFNKHTSLRKFGGEASKVYEESTEIKKKVIKYIFTNIDILFFEIRHMVDFFSKINKNCFWFPNVRNKIIEPKLQRNYQKRFVFISAVKHEKGIDDIIEAAKQLDSEYIIDIYGPIEDLKYSKEYFKKHHVSYKGVIETDNVLQTLSKYDVLLLPTFYKGEGYPGIIIEAYSLGIPSIATTLHGIKEIVDNYKTGILIEPKHVDELVKAIKYFNDENYKFMSENAYKKFDDFNSDMQTKLFLERLIDV